MSLFDTLLGRPLASSETTNQQLSVATGVPALGLDALASTAYGPEAALMVLLPLGTAGNHYFPIIMMLVVAQLFLLYLSYQQTITAYPDGAGAYIVAKKNLGKKTGAWAAVALLIDYLLNVCVGIAAGVGAIVSAFPIFQPHTLMLCLIILLTLTVLNLRGIRESGLAFVIPTIIFILCVGIAIIIGLFQSWLSNGHPQAIVQPPTASPAIATVSIWLLLGTFANGLTAMTGVEAISNAVPLFHKPTIKNAHRTLTIIVLILGSFLLALGYLCPAYHIVAMDENRPGYQTILSQLIAAVAGQGIFYYIATFSIFIVLTYSAQTSFTDFPRVCRLLAEDHFLPHFFANQGRRLVFSHGIIILAIFSTLLLIIFGGVTNALIPLFAIGAFIAFIFSQSGMVVYWLRKSSSILKNPKILYNAIGAFTTSIALIIIILAKFIEGAWLVIVVIPALVILLTSIRKHYKKIMQERAQPLALRISKTPPIIIIPVNGWDRATEKAVQFALFLSNDITAVYVTTDSNDKITQKVIRIWGKKVETSARAMQLPIPHLEIIYSPFRQIYQPILDFVAKIKDEQPGRLIAVIIPELVEAHWYEHLLHNLHAAGLRALLLRKHDNRTIVITTPWYTHND